MKKKKENRLATLSLAPVDTTPLRGTYSSMASSDGYPESVSANLLLQFAPRTELPRLQQMLATTQSGNSP